MKVGALGIAVVSFGVGLMMDGNIAGVVVGLAGAFVLMCSFAIRFASGLAEQNEKTCIIRQ